jgi:hypothetical protein
MKRNTSETFELFFTPRFPLLFLAGALALAVMGNTTCDLLKSYLGDQRVKLWVIFGISVAALILLVAAAYAAGVFKARLSALREYRFLDKPGPNPRKGLIAFASLKQRAHLEKALAYHQKTLERVWLIATRESRETAEAIRRDYESAGLQFTIITLDEEWDLIKARQTVESIYSEKLGELKEEEVIADFTGGTKPMTAGMIFACLNPSRALEYVPADYRDGEPKLALEPVEYTFDVRTIAQLGQPS